MCQIYHIYNIYNISCIYQYIPRHHNAIVANKGTGRRPADLSVLRGKVGNKKLIWTPGVNLAVGDGEMGQRYGAPDEAIRAGSDGIIVGSGIYKSDDPKGVAAAYAEISWQALTKRSD